MQMLDKFPMEGGQKDPKQRIIPFLPGRWCLAIDWGQDLLQLSNLAEVSSQSCFLAARRKWTWVHAPVIHQLVQAGQHPASIPDPGLLWSESRSDLCQGQVAV